MIHYLLLDANKNIVQRGMCPSKDHIPKPDGLTYEIIDEKDERTPTKGRKETYEDLRRFDYPNIGDQLDALWRIVDAAGLTSNDPQVKSVRDQIAAVKAKYPKK